MSLGNLENIELVGTDLNRHSIRWKQLRASWNSPNSNYITNFTTLRTMGDRLMTSLTKNLGLSTPAVESAATSSASATSGYYSRAVYWAGSKILTVWALMLLPNIF